MKKIIAAGLVAIGAVAILPFSAAQAVMDSTTSVINGVIGSTISVAVSGDVTINLTPTAGGATSTGSHNVTVSTNNTGGYSLQLASNTASTNLTSGANSIAASAGSLGTPTALAANTWGYRIDSFAANMYAGVPATASPVTLKTTATTATADVTAVTYGINATTAKPNGTYTNTVRYTALTN